MSVLRTLSTGVCNKVITVHTQLQRVNDLWNLFNFLPFTYWVFFTLGNASQYEAQVALICLGL